MNNRRLPVPFNPAHSDLARKFCMLGATDDELARLLEVPRETIDAWLAEVAGFAAAVKAGREEADATVAGRLCRILPFRRLLPSSLQGGADGAVPSPSAHPSLRVRPAMGASAGGAQR
jgi:hypothetical protein